MKSKFKQLSASALAALLVVPAFASQGSANSHVVEDSEAQLFGEYNLNSSESITVMVELDEPSLLQAKHTGRSQSETNLEQAREAVKNALAEVSPSSEVNREYDTVFSGFSVEVPQNELSDVLELDGVQSVYPDVHYDASEFEPELIDEESFSPAMMDSAPFIGAPEVWEDLGVTGEGITVAIIDTGVDYTHPDLESSFGEYLGYDFVDNNDDPNEGEGQYHGTHVAGTVAADGLIQGVAPDATLVSYRVLGPNGGTTQDVVASIELAVQDGVDVMNLSLGNSLNDADFATSIALDWAMSEGVVAVVANGNSGPNNWTVGSPGTSRDAISVGATQLPYDAYNAGISTEGDVSYPSAEVMGYPSVDELMALNGEELEFVDVGLAGPGDFEDVDVDGKIALIERGEYAFVDKAENAKDNGAVGAIIYNNAAGSQPEVPGLAVPTIMTTQEDGQTLLAELEAGNNTVTFDIAFDQVVPESMADFSSRGPAAPTFGIKPDVSAPGVAIVSTMPEAFGYYASLQGTSMAAPHVAGVAALILEANPDRTPGQVKSAIMNTAEPVLDRDGNPYPFNTQGAGSVRPYDAITAETLVTPGSHTFGVFDKDRGRQVERQHFEVQNLSDERKQYEIDVAFNDGEEHISVNTSSNLSVQAGSSQKVNTVVQLNASELDAGYYEATITLTNGDEVIEVPSIAFVMEPDYPRVTHLFLGSNSDGTIAGEAYLPGGAETFALQVYKEGTTTLVDVPYTNEDVSSGYHQFTWDGLTSAGEQLAPGAYDLYAFALKAGKGDHAYGGTLTVDENGETNLDLE
ncbi:S8 family serine peptidase [Alteribacter natronophilus]|uniref:S8 family serine peptidase n=1 Tax=Alteribacter natronophilus TaxID=2583810 RepID=UPI00110D8812|nr:S8 family serine peptidase [Alteribacter natronophilus]TMW71769.1 peptidase S8 [Alteribacter natronophilus]